MHLTREEERTLDGEEGDGPAKAMELLVALGEIYDADELIPIESAQIAGVSYKTMGDAGLEFIEDFSRKVDVKVRTMLNPAGMDLQNPMNESDEFREKQKRLIHAYGRMGIEVSCTCTPYFAGNRPKRGAHLAWSESSAVSFANSVLGARTNREGGPSALMAAVIGKTPDYGLHRKENRAPTVVIEAEKGTSSALLGHIVGKKVGEGIPYFQGFSPDEDELKSLGAAMAATGSVALYHVQDITPEADDFDIKDLKTIHVTKEDIQKLRDELITEKKPEVVVIGCPHLSGAEIKNIAKKLKGKEKRKDSPDLRLYTSRFVKERNPEAVKIIERFGSVIADTCMVVSPLEDEYSVSATDSGKAATYLPKLTGQEVLYADRETLLEMMIC
ncbi:MAG: aconitase X catalytic domain-containing protein [Thermoplasmata archaeon]